MSKHLTHDLTYDAALDEVAAMLRDPAFREEVCERTGMLRHEVTIENRGEVVEVTIDQVQASQGLPSFATKFVGKEIRIRQEETWTSPDRADLHVTIPGKPGEMAGSIGLVETETGTIERVDAEITVRIPMVAGKIEKLISDMLVKALTTENQVGREYLSR